MYKGTEAWKNSTWFPLWEQPHSQDGMVGAEEESEAWKAEEAVPLTQADQGKWRLRGEIAICGITLPFWSNELSGYRNRDQSQEAYEEHRQKSKANL